LMKYTDLIDASCGQDLISYIGYEVDYSSKENKINLLIDKRSGNAEGSILSDQGKDNYVLDEKIKKENINRNKINIKRPTTSKDVHARMLASNRYKNDLYIASNYYANNENLLSINKKIVGTNVIIAIISLKLSL